MTLQDHILQRREAIARRWYQRILDSYPVQTARFLAREENPFQNPVGGTIAPAVGRLVELLAAPDPRPDLRDPLDEIVRIRAVQSFSAAEAVGFVLELKQVVRQELAAAGDLDLHADPLAGELVGFDDRVDRVVLQAFDLYMECREQLYALRAEEGRRRTAVLMRRYGMDWEDAEPDPAAGPPI